MAALEKQSERLGKDTVILALLQTQRISKKRSRAEIASNVTACRGVVNLATSQPSFNKSILLHKVFKETPNFESLVAQINCDADPAVLKQQSTLSHIQVFRDKFTKSLYKHIHKWIRGGIFSLYCAYVVAATQFPDVTISEVIQDIAFLNNSEIFLYKNLLTNKSYVMDGLLRIDFRDLELLLKYAAVYPQNDSRYSVDFSKPPQYKDLPSKQDAVLRLRSVFHPLTSDLEEPRPRPPKNHYAGSQSSRPISGSVKKRSSNHKAINTKKAKQLKIKEISNDDQSVSQASAEVYSVNEESADEQSVPGANGQSVHDLSSDVSADALLAFKMQLLGETESSEASAVLSKSGSLLVQDLFNIPMTYDKLKCLDGKTWLNDEVINFMGNLLSVRDTAISAELKDRKRLLIMNSFFMAKLYENSVYDFEKVARWTKKEVVFKCRLIFIPVNCGNTHWVLVVIFMELKRVCCFDSMANVARGRLLIRLTLTWLRDVWRKQEEGDFPGGWSEEPAEPCPQQMNGCDCGVYVLAFMDFLADGFSTSHIDPAFIVNYRHKICTYIVSGVIADPRIDTITSCFHRTQSLQAAERAAVWSQEKLSNSAVVFVLVDDDDDAVSAAAVKEPSSSSNKAVTYTSEQEEQTAVSLKGGSSCDMVSADGDGSPGAQANTPKDLEKMAGILASIGANVDPQDGILAHPVVRAIVQFLSDEGNSTSKKFKKKKNIDPYTLSLEQENARLREELSMLKNRN